MPLKVKFSDFPTRTSLTGSMDLFQIIHNEGSFSNANVTLDTVTTYIERKTLGSDDGSGIQVSGSSAITGGLNVTGGITASAIVTNNLYSSSIYIGYRNDGLSGSGTILDPYDGSSAEKFDGVLRRYRIAGSQSLDVNILPGEYQTRGTYDYYNYGGLIHTYGWSALAGWRIRGSGTNSTRLKLTGSVDCVYSGSTYSLLTSCVISSYHFENTPNIEVCDLTIDGNYTQISESIRNSYGIGINVNAITLKGNSSYVHNVRVLNVAANNGYEGFPVNLTQQVGSGLNDGILTYCNWIENVEAYPIKTTQAAGMTCLCVSHNNADSGSTVGGEAGGYINNCAVICETSSNRVQSFGGYATNGLIISNNYSQNAYNAVYFDTFRVKNLSVCNNKLLNTQNSSIAVWGSSTTNVDPYAASNIHIHGNILEQKSNTVGIYIGANTGNNFIITDNSFVSSGSGQSGIYPLAVAAGTFRNIKFENNYIDTSSYRSLTDCFTTSSMLSTDYAVGNKNYVSGSLTLQSGNVTANSFRTSGSNVGTPEMYGAKGDGVTDDWLSFKHALISHSIVELDAKVYAVRGYIGIPSYRTIRGKGKHVTTIKIMDNSPFGYGQRNAVFTNTMYGSYGWTGATGSVVGSGSVVLNKDVTLRDMSPYSPLYNVDPSTSFAGVGYDENDGLNGCRKNIIIEGMTLDCNFNNQAKHSSYNFASNPTLTDYPYISNYSWKVRSTVDGMTLNGENITVQDIVVKNFGYGVCYASGSSNTPLDYSNTSTYPVYVESFPIIISGCRTADGLSLTSSNNDSSIDKMGNSSLQVNKVINCDVVDIANVNLMNPYSNASCIYINNQTSVYNGVLNRSTYPTGGEILNCLVDPGSDRVPMTASLWNGSYLDEFTSSSLKQSAGTLFEWLVKSGSATGSNGDYAVSNTYGAYQPYLIKISGSWIPAGNGYSVFKHPSNGISGYKINNCVIRNCNIGTYLDSWKNNNFVENNQLINVGSAFRTTVSDNELSASYNDVIIKNNYVKFVSDVRTYLHGHVTTFYDVLNGSGSRSTEMNIRNLVIENNIFELPITASVAYGTTTVAREYPRYIGLWFGTETNPSGSYQYKRRNVQIKNNKFINWNPLKTETNGSGELYGYNIPIWFNYNTASVEFDTTDAASGPFTNSIVKFKSQFLPRYIIENNTYNDAIYPSTASLVPILYSMQGTGNTYYYPVKQVNRIDDLYAGSITSVGFVNLPISSSVVSSNSSIITGSMYFDAGKLWIYTGTGNADGKAGWQTASLGG